MPRPCIRTLLIEKMHGALQHSSSRAIKAAIESKFWWKGMKQDTRRILASCLACSMARAVFRRRNSIGGHLATNAPRISWSLDCAPSIKGPNGTRASILVMVDDFSKFVILRVLPNLTSKAVADAFLEAVLCWRSRPACLGCAT